MVSNQILNEKEKVERAISLSSGDGFCRISSLLYEIKTLVPCSSEKALELFLGAKDYIEKHLNVKFAKSTNIYDEFILLNIHDFFSIINMANIQNDDPSKEVVYYITNDNVINHYLRNKRESRISGLENMGVTIKIQL